MLHHVLGSKGSRSLSYLFRAGVVSTIVLLAACSGEVTVTYNPLTQIAVLNGKVRGKSKRITQTANCPGTITVDDPDCGKIRITCSCTGPTTTTIECGDPLLAQVPSNWTYQDGSYRSNTGTAGKILVADAATFKAPTRGPIATEAGFKALVARADAVFPNGAELDVTATFRTQTDPAGVALKAIDTAVVTFEQDTKVCSEPAIEIADREPAPNFALINDAAHRLVVPATPPPARTLPKLLIGIAIAVLVLLVLAILLRRKRRPEVEQR